jgi:hypothetical protein
MLFTHEIFRTRLKGKEEGKRREEEEAKGNTHTEG